MIIFTDGTSGDTVPGFENGLGVEPSYFTGDFIVSVAISIFTTVFIRYHIYIPYTEINKRMIHKKSLKISKRYSEGVIRKTRQYNDQKEKRTKRQTIADK